MTTNGIDTKSKTIIHDQFVNIMHDVRVSFRTIGPKEYPDYLEKLRKQISDVIVGTLPFFPPSDGINSSESFLTYLQNNCLSQNSPFMQAVIGDVLYYRVKPIHEKYQADIEKNAGFIGKAKTFINYLTGFKEHPFDDVYVDYRDEIGELMVKFSLFKSQVENFFVGNPDVAGIDRRYKEIQSELKSLGYTEHWVETSGAMDKFKAALEAYKIYVIEANISDLKIFQPKEREVELDFLKLLNEYKAEAEAFGMAYNEKRLMEIATIVTSPVLRMMLDLEPIKYKPSVIANKVQRKLQDPNFDVEAYHRILAEEVNGNEVIMAANGISENVLRNDESSKFGP